MPHFSCFLEVRLTCAVHDHRENCYVWYSFFLRQWITIVIRP